MLSSVVELPSSWNVVAAATPAEWLAARERYLTASDVSAVLGCNPYKSRNKILKAKGDAMEGRVSDERNVGAMYAGQFCEEGVVRWFLHDRKAEALALGEAPPVGGVLRNADGVSVLVRHHDEGLRLAASPDALVVTSDGLRYLLEIKLLGPGWVDEATGDIVPGTWHKWGNPCTSRAWKDFGRGRSDLPCPVPHWIQLQTQMLCTGERFGWVVGACGTKRTDHPFSADLDMHKRIEDATVEFWKELGA